MSETVRAGTVSVVLEVQGDARRKIEGIVSAIESVEQAAASATAGGGLFSRVGGDASHILEGVRGIRSAARAGVLGMGMEIAQEMGQMLQQAGQQLQDFGTGILTTMASFGQQVLRFSTANEGVLESFRFVYGDRADALMRQTNEVASRTSMLTSQVQEIVTTLGRTGVTDPFASVTTSAGQAITAVEALNDLAATMGSRGAEHLSVSIRSFLGGATEASAVRSAQARFDLPMEIVNELKAVFRGTDGDLQARYQGFAQIISQHFGGAGRAMEGTTGFMLANLEDKWQLFMTSLGSTALDSFKPLLREVSTWLGNLTADGSAFRDAFKALADIAATVAGWLFKIVKFATEFAQAHPTLVKWTVILTAIAAVVAIIIGKLMVGIVVFGGLIVAALVLAGIVSMIAMVLAPLMITAMIAVAAIAAVFLPPILAAMAIWQNDTWGVRTGLERVWNIMKAMYQLINSEDAFGEGLIDNETFAELERLGITQLVLDIWGAFVRLREGAKYAWEGMMEGFRKVGAVLGPVWNQIFGIEESVAAVGQTGMSSGSLLDFINSMSPDDWKRIGEAVGKFLGDMVKNLTLLVTVLETVVEIINTFKSAQEELIGGADQVGQFLGRFGLVPAGDAPPPPPPPVPGERWSTGLLPAETRVPLGPTPERTTRDREVSLERGAELSRAFADRIIQAITGLATRPVQVRIDGKNIASVVAGQTTRDNGRLGV